MAKNNKITNNAPDLSKSSINNVLQSVFREYIERDGNNMLKEDLDTTKLSDRQKRVWQKAVTYLTEARDLLYCCDSPFSHPRDQQKVGSLFSKFVQELKALK